MSHLVPFARHSNFYRDYDPSTGRYLETDPIGLDGGLNLYEYAAGNPIAVSDPTGRCPWCAAAALGALTDLTIQLAFNGFNFKCVDWSEVAVSGVAAGVGIGLAQKFGTLSTAFRGPARPTYRFLRSKWIRLESHPTSRNAPNWASYPHWHADFAGKPLSKLHLPLTEPLVGIPAAALNYGKDDCECSE